MWDYGKNEVQDKESIYSGNKIVGKRRVRKEVYGEKPRGDELVMMA